MRVAGVAVAALITNRIPGLDATETDRMKAATFRLTPMLHSRQEAP